jgi:hypothetical protein
MSSKIESKLIGTTLSATATFKNSAGAAFAPSTVNLKYKKSDTPGTIVTVPVTPAAITFLCSADVLLDTAGTWNFRWEAIGANSVAEEFQILVVDTKVK